MNLRNFCNLSRHPRLDSYHSVPIKRVATAGSVKHRQQQIQQVMFFVTPLKGHTSRKTAVLRAQEVQSEVISGLNEAEAKPQPPTKKTKKQAGFTNVLKFQVSEAVLGEFQNIWQEREDAMRAMPGFVSFDISEEGDNVFIVSNEWGSRKEFEDWACSDVCRRTHLPVGVFQFVPKKGEGFPEDFVPFVQMDEPVNAKY